MLRKSSRTLLMIVVFLASLGVVSTAAAQETQPWDFEAKIVGGMPASPGEWPWQVLVILGNDIGPFGFCGGSILGPQMVLTAAHCVSGGVTYIEIVAGDQNLTTIEGQQVPVASFFVHPKYSPSNQDSDAAVLMLSRPLIMRRGVAPVRLLSPAEAILTQHSMPAFITGWGATSEGGALSERLMEAEVPIIGNGICGGPGAYEGLITDNMLCAGFPEGGVDSCQGDSGGPLVISDGDGGWLQAGITSWGFGCARPGQPGVYARVSALYDWITYFLEIPQCDGKTATIIAQPGDIAIIGTPNSDVIVGNDMDNLIYGNGGNDTICGLGGDDMIDAGTGSDWVDGGDGSDMIRGGSGADTLSGGAGNDYIRGDAGGDEIHGGPGGDTLEGNLGDDLLFGGAGDDFIFGSPGNDDMRCGEGVDFADGGPGRDTADEDCETVSNV